MMKDKRTPLYSPLKRGKIPPSKSPPCKGGSATPTKSPPYEGGEEKKGLLKKQRWLRKNMPLPEVILWQKLRRNQLGVKFRRQFAVDGFILDFYCPQLKIGIEIDGESHYENEKARYKDRIRDKDLRRKGIKILRFLNPDVMRNPEGVLLRIKDEIEKRTPSKSPPYEGGEEKRGLGLPPYEDGEKLKRKLNK